MTTQRDPEGGLLEGRPAGGRGDGGLRGRAARRSVRRLPLFRLLVYYAALAGVAAALVHLFPSVRPAVLAPLDGGPVGGRDLLDPSGGGAFQGLPGNVSRLATTAVVMLGSVALVLPIAWVYTFTRRLRYERSLVHSLVMLPPVVAGTVMVVKNSLALAFSLAGIVAAVRFRTTVKDPKDAVHVFLVMAVGIAAGVQALDIALLLSVTFSLVVLALWKYDFETTDGGRDPGLLSIGDGALMLARSEAERNGIRERLRDLADEIETDGILLLHTGEPQSARQVAEVVLSQLAKDWRFTDEPLRRDDVYTLQSVVSLKKKSTPVDLLGELEDRWSPTVAAAEYVPYQP